MQSSLWKLAVIAGVVALCLLVIDHARKDMANRPDGDADVASSGDDDQGAILNDADGELESEDEFGEKFETAHGEHNQTGDEVSTADHVDADLQDSALLAETGGSIPDDDPFDTISSNQNQEPQPLDDGSTSAPTGDEEPPIIGESVPVPPFGGSGEPRLLSEPAEIGEPPLTESQPGEEAPFTADETFDPDPVGLFDAAEEEQAQNNQDSPQPETKSDVDSEAGPALEELTPVETLPTDDETELPALTAPQPADDAAMTDNETPAAETVTETDTFDPFSDDVPLPTSDDQDAPLENPLQDSPEDDDSQEGDANQPQDPVTIEFPEGLDLSLPNPAELTETEPQPLESEPLDVNIADEPAMAEEAIEDSAAADGAPEEVIEEPIPDESNESEPGALDGPFDFADEDKPASPLAEDAPVETPPLISPEEDQEIPPAEMPFDEAESDSGADEMHPITVAPLDVVPANEPVAEPAAETPELDETTSEPFDEEETEVGELPKLEKIPPRNTATDSEPVEQEQPAEAFPEPESDSLEEDVFGEGTVDRDAPRGPQKPQLTIEKQSPPSAILGKPFIYSIVVKNVGRSSAGRVVVKDEIPRGAKLTGTIPQAELAGKKLIWKLGTLDPGQERKISIRVIPVAEGPIGSVATVNFVAEVAAQTVVTKPELGIKISAPDQAALGKPVVFQFEVANTGNVVARKVVLRDIMPKHFAHPGGNDLEYEIGDLPAGKTRDVQLTLTAAAVGAAVNQAIVTADGDISVKAEAKVMIVDEGVTLRRTGPKSRILNRATSYTNSIKNKAKQPISDIVVVEQVPAGMKFLKASPGGSFDPRKQTVTWHIQQIGGEQTEDVSVMLVPEKPGTLESIVRVYGREGELDSAKSQTAVRGFSKLDLQVAYAEQPLEIGERVSYRITIHNRGTAAATGVLTSLLVPEEMKLISVKGPGEYKQSDQQVDFSEIVEIPAQKQVTFDVLLEAKSAGDTRLQVQIQSDQMKKPFSREVATLVYSDQE